MLHGGPGASHDYLRPGFDLLAAGPHPHLLRPARRRAVAGAAGTPVGWREQVADLEALREAWGLERLTICGYSWGGLLAMLYATEHPGPRGAPRARVPGAGVARRAPGVRATFSARNMSPALQAERAALRDSGLRERDPEAYQRRLFELSVVPYFVDPTLVRQLTPFRIIARTQQEVWSSLGDYDLRPRLAELDVPALVLHGKEDVIPAWAAEEAARLLARRVAPALAVRARPHVEQAEAFARARERVSLTRDVRRRDRP